MQITDEMVAAASLVICRSGKFETGQGTCALLCMGQLGDPRKRGCSNATVIHGKLMRAALEAALGAQNKRCPTCNSPDPKLHPAMQFEGEVQVCRDLWHRGNACIEDLAEALRPFAAYISLRDNNYTTKGYGDDCALGYLPGTINAGAATVGDLRRARAVLERWGLK